jgi:hypothetical protein
MPKLPWKTWHEVAETTVGWETGGGTVDTMSKVFIANAELEPSQV